MNYEEQMKAVQTVRDPTCVCPDRASAATEGERCPENLKTMLDTAKCMATENEILAERIYDFLFGMKNCVDRGNQKEPLCFRDALQDQIEICSKANKQLQEICVMLGA